MATRKIPEAFEHICDGCKKTETSASSSRPKFWSTLTISRDAYDYQGCAVADASVSRLLCENCTSAVTKAVNASLSPASPAPTEEG